MNPYLYYYYNYYFGLSGVCCILSVRCCFYYFFVWILIWGTLKFSNIVEFLKSSSNLSSSLCDMVSLISKGISFSYFFVIFFISGYPNSNSVYFAFLFLSGFSLDVFGLIDFLNLLEISLYFSILSSSSYCSLSIFK
jgi:hypothetical protein